MSSALGFSNSDSQSTTTNRTITAQDSVVAQENGLAAGQNLYAAGGDVNITDGGAFDLVGSVVDTAAKLLNGVFSDTITHLGDATNDILTANRVQNQESALAAQENTNGLIKFAIGAAAVVGAIYIYKKAA